jgi:nucleoid DNA-binding protein
MKNEKQITHEVVDKIYPHLSKPEIVSVVRDVFSGIGRAVGEGEKVLVKNFGSLSLKKRKPRRRYDQGVKDVVETEPKKIIELIQSPNIFKK